MMSSWYRCGMNHTRNVGKDRTFGREIKNRLILFGIIIPIIRFFTNGIHFIGFIESLGFDFIFIETTERLDFQFQGGFKGFPFFIKGRLSHLDTEFLDVGEDLFTATTVGGLHASEWGEMRREIIGTNTMGGQVGRHIEVVGRMFIISMSFGGTFFGSPDKDFIELVPHGFALQDGKEPSGGTNPGRFQKERRLQKAKDNGIAQKGNGKGGRDQLPCDTAENGGGDGTHKTEIQHGLDPIGDTKDIFIFSNDNIDRGDTSNDKETERDGHLTSTHKAGKILPAILEETFTRPQGHG
mmetsp:Transcript_38243/g.42849  ORF Transcript_38243/g.42849 Transcript_38243/m.42849 type:complete len:296 (+) Transcript_38243:223-1110(+)